MRAVLNAVRGIGHVARQPQARLVVVLSGPIGSGKTTLAESLTAALGARLIRTRDILEDEYAPATDDRGALQQLGEQLDAETGGSWVVSAVIRAERQADVHRPIVVDAARVPDQIERLAAVPSFRLFHIYLSASDKRLAERYPAGKEKEFPNYQAARQNPTEANIKRMRPLAQMRLSTTCLPRSAVFTFALIRLHTNRARYKAQACARWYVVGAIPAGMFLLPYVWLLPKWGTSLLSSLLIGVVGLLYLSMSILVGAACSSGSPIERDPPRDSSGAEKPS